MTQDRLTVQAMTPQDAQEIARRQWTTYPVELGGSMGGSLPTQPVAGVKARVNPGRPVTTGPAVCRGCRSLVWWSGVLWSNADGTWHRCGIARRQADRETLG